MSPFLQFRVWLRRASGPERAAAAVTGVLVLTLAALALVPVAGSKGTVATGGLLQGDQQTASQTGTAASPSPGGRAASSAATGATAPAGPVTSQSSTGSAAGGPVAAGQGGAAVVGSATSVSSVPSAPSTVAANTRSCGPMTATDQGVTPTEVKVDVDVADLSGQAGNSLAGIPPPQTEEAMFQAAIDALNRSGGIRCRKVVAKYYTADALDPSSLQQVCLEIVADHPFALLDDGLASPDGPTSPRDCPPSYKIPEFGSLAMGRAEFKQFSPYLFGDNSSAEQIVNDWVLGANQLGWFKGYGKIGLLEQDCIPDLNGIVMADLASIGVPSAKVVTFDFGCPDQIPPPDQVALAETKFESSGVTHVMDDGGVYESYFSKDAAAQGYRPHYSVADQATIALWDNPNFGPDPANFAGALAITPTQYGAENTAGSQFGSETQACDRAMAAEHLPSAQTSPDGFAGVACALVQMLATGADNAPSLVRSELATGLAKAGKSVDMPFPAGPGDFLAAAGQHGGGYWRADTWVTACRCFRVSRPAFSPDFGMP